MEYIIESSNWIGKVVFNDKNYQTETSRVIESCTLAFEKIYLNKNIKNFHMVSILDLNGDVIDEDIIDEEDTFDHNLKLSLITKCYNKRNASKPHLHYYVLNDLIIKNASSEYLLEKFNTLMDKSKKQYPVLYKFVTENFKEEKILQEKEIIS